MNIFRVPKHVFEFDTYRERAIRKGWPLPTSLRIDKDEWVSLWRRHEKGRI